jgi:ATP-dependent DNA helicase RecG
LAQATTSRHRLAFDELLLLQLASLERKLAWQKGAAAPRLDAERSTLDAWISKLPFELTAGQRGALDEILADMARNTPMNRLLEGDVGSGKTVVAVLAAMTAVANGYQAAIMAPTSVLAQQHFVTFQYLIERLQGGETARRPNGEKHLRDGAGSSEVESLGLFGNRETNSVTVSLRTAKSKSEPADITIGTHALISENVNFGKLGLVIIDEQHRFGVEQRAILMNKAESAVHLLTMTATPIPRTLALTAYGDLDLSIIDQLPANRLPIRTHVVPQRKRTDKEGYLAGAMQRGEQVFVVCPLIEESENITEVRAATAEFERLQKVFPDFRLALLHGRMKAQEKDAILEAFKRHEFDLLVATPVVEVGLDVPNATMLVIEGAERFGLAQLHQLRGRVGRGEKQSYCFLLSDVTDAKDITRLRHMEAETSGIRLAELDLATRGPGEVYGHRQSGIPELKAASFMDVELTQAAREEAEKLVSEGLIDDSLLRNELNRTQRMVEMN